MRERAPQVIKSADHVLTLLEILRRDNTLRINAAARELGVAPSTVHRLVQTLVFRGYAVRKQDHSYMAGPALPHNPAIANWSPASSTWHAILEGVVKRIGETAHVVVREGTSAIFVDSVVSEQALTVGSRIGTRLSAERSSGGKILLAQLPPDHVRALYQDRSDVDIGKLLLRLASIRRERFALSESESERGISAIAILAQSDPSQQIAVTVSGPSLRFDRRRALSVLADLQEEVGTGAHQL